MPIHKNSWKTIFSALTSLILSAPADDTQTMIRFVLVTVHKSTWPRFVTQGAAFLGPRPMDGSDVNDNVWRSSKHTDNPQHSGKLDRSVFSSNDI